MFFEAPGNGGLEDVLLAVEANKGNIAGRLQSVTKCTYQGVSYLESCSSSYDMAEVTPEHFERLVRNIAVSNAYNLIVLDMDYAHSRLATTAMNLSVRTIFVSNGTAVANDKFERVYAHSRLATTAMN